MNIGKIKNWLKDPYNLIFLGILLFALFIRLYYFSLTKNQPLWWDEADYLAYSKNLAGFKSDWIVTKQHNSLFPFIVAFLFSIGINEVVAKFIVELIPSILIILLTYLVVSLMYHDKRIALISSFLMAVSWPILFNSMRFHLGIPGLFFALMGMYCFWKGYEKKEKIFGKIKSKWALPLTVFFIVLSYTIRRGYFIFALFFLFYMLFTRNFKLLIKNKYNWIGLILGLIMVFSAENFIFISSIEEVGATYYHPENKINLLPLQIFKAYFLSSGAILPNILFYLFLIGFLIILGNILLSFGHIRKIKGDVRADLFNFISILATLAVFIFILRTQHTFGEPRWYFPLILASFICISKSSLFIADLSKRYHKFIGITIIILFIGLGGLYQYQKSEELIITKVGSFEGLKQASLFLKETSNEEDIIISQPVPQTIYYSERKVMQPEHIAGIVGSNYLLGDFLNGLEKNINAKYLFISFSEPGYPDWMKQQTPLLWKIPFMDTTIDFETGQQNIRQSITYEKVTFTLIDVKQDVFIYEIKRV